MTETTRDAPARNTMLGPSLRVVLPYVLFAIVWILLSDSLLYRWATSADLLRLVEVIKTLVFIYLTAFMLYWLLRREFRERQRAETALRQNRDLLQAVLDHLPVGVWITNARGQIVHANPASSDIWGLPAEAAQPPLDTLQGWWGATGDPVEMEEWTRPIPQQPETTRSLQIQRFDNDLRDLVHTCVALFGEQQEVVGTIVVLQDVTAYRQAVKRSEQAEAQYRLMFQSNPVPMFVCDEATRAILAANDMSLGQYGYTREELAALSMADLLAPSPDIVLIGTEAPWPDPDRYRPGIYRHRRKDGAWLYVDVVAHPVDFDGRSAIVAQVQDVTDRIASETALRASERRYRSLFETMREGFALYEVIHDAAGHPVDYKCLEVNEAFEVLTRQPRYDLVGRTTRELSPQPQPDRLEIFSRVAATGESARYAFGHERSGRYFEVAVFCPGDNQFAVIYTDVTERRNAENEQRRLYQLAHDRAQELQTLLDLIPVGIAVLQQPSGNFMSLNPAAVNMMGFDPFLSQYPRQTTDEPVPGGPELWHAGRRLTLAETPLENVLRTNQPVSGAEYDMVLADGQLLNILEYAAPLRDERGQVRGAVAVFIDITALKQAEAELISSQQRYRDLAEFLPQTLFETDARGMVTYANRAGQALFGYEADDLQHGVEAIGRVDPSQMPAARAGMLRLLQDGQPINGAEFVLHRKDGTAFPALLYLSPASGGTVRGLIIDITDRKQAEAERARLQADYQVLFDAHPLPMWLYDRDTWRLLAVNQAAIDHYGYTRDEFLQMLILDIQPQEEIEPLLKSLGSVPPPTPEQVGITRHGDNWHHRLKDGRLIDVEITAHTQTFAGHAAELVLAVNITERRQAERALLDSERRFRALIENSSDGIALLDAQGQITYASPSSPHILGYDAGELVGHALVEVLHPDDRERLKHMLARLLISVGATATEQYRLRHRDGSWRWIEGTTTNLLAEPAVGALVTNYRDITDRKSAEASLRESEERYRRLAENAPDIIFRYRVVDPAGFEYISPASGSILGYAPFDIYQATAHEVNHMITEADLQSMATQFAGEWGQMHQTVQAVRRDGQRIWLDLRAVPVRDDGRLVAVEGIASDISDRTRGEQALNDANEQLAAALLDAHHLADETQAADRLKTEFLRTTSHELRTPLTTILAAMGQLEGKRGEIADERRKYVGQMRASARNLLNIVNDLLTGAQLEAGREMVALENLSPEPVMNTVVALTSPSAVAKNLRLELDLPAESLPQLRADAGRFQQILENLLTNALKFTERGRITLRARPAGDDVRFEVEDTGIGVPIDQQSRLFQPFVQLHGGTNHKYAGTGLGLSIARRLAEMMHGSLELYSAGENQGSTLTLRLPCAPADAPTPAPSEG